MDSRRTLVLVIPFAVGSGCNLERQAVQTVQDEVERHWANRHLEGARYASGVSASQRSSAPSDFGNQLARRTKPGSLSALIVDMLENNPELAAASDRAWAKAHRVPQETTLPNPMLTTKTFGESQKLADGNMVFVLGVEQEIPMPAKLAVRGQVAVEEARMALHELNEVRQRLIAELKRAYAELFVIDRTTEIVRKNIEVLDDVIAVARGRLAAGATTQSDILRAQVERDQLTVSLIEFAQRRIGSLAQVNALLNRPMTSEVSGVRDWTPPDASLRVAVLLDRARSANPRLARLQAQIRRDQHALQLSRLEALPDFTVGFEWNAMTPRKAYVPLNDPEPGIPEALDLTSEEGADSWAIVANVRVPIWYTKIAAGIREADRQLSASRREHVAAANALSSRIADAAARIQAQKDLIALLDGSLIPKARQAYDVSIAGYTAGINDFESLIQSWEEWAELRRQYLRVAGDLERSVADLEQELGYSLIEAVTDAHADAAPPASPRMIQENAHDHR